MNFYAEIIPIIKQKDLNEKQLNKLKRDLALKYKLKEIPTNIQTLLHCRKEELKQLKTKLLTKPTRTISGVAPIAIMTKPFPCPHGKCIMCPGGPKSAFGNIPQSYTGKEPATMRGLRNNFDPYLQVFNRLEQYIILGHNCEKAELIIMGGTFPALPKYYQEEFVKFAFKAMNDFSELFYRRGKLNHLKFKEFFELPCENISDKERTKRIQKKLLKIKNKKKTALKLEQNRNETAKIRCTALCIETRPDFGLLEHGNKMLKLGCTRVELGIQSVYDDTLKRICRGHSTKETIESIKTLKDLGFKVAGHYMPGLPGKSGRRVSREKDIKGMEELFSNPDYRPDMLKIYPCMVAKGTELYELWKKGQFRPLEAEEAAELIAEFKKSVPEYCRIMRVQRDIPTNQISAGVEMTNLRQYMHRKFKIKCRCIRCREPKNNLINWKKIKINVVEYEASKGKEFFISAVDTVQDILIGFCRLRFPSAALHEEITEKSALVRELHVYGTATAIGNEGAVQHKGWGKKLLQKAEALTKKRGKNKIVVISGIGVREYYKKLGYKLEGAYMVK